MKTRKYVIQMKPFKGYNFFDDDQEESHARLDDAKRALRAARKDANEYVELTSYRLVLRTEEILNH